jgi:hypothetical protein
LETDPAVVLVTEVKIDTLGVEFVLEVDVGIVIVMVIIDGAVPAKERQIFGGDFFFDFGFELFLEFFFDLFL